MFGNQGSNFKKAGEIYRLKFVAKYLCTYLEQPSGFSYNVPNELLAVRLERYGL